MLIGGANWASLPRMMELNPGKMPLLKCLQQPLERCDLSKEAASWLVSNADRVEPQTFELLKYMREKNT